MNNYKRSKINYINSKYRWELIEPYLDVNIKLSNKIRSKKFITLREFKDLVLSGKSVRDLSSQGYSLHLLRFFSRFCQGKISLNKQDLFQEYKIQDLSKIAKKYKINRPDLCCLRQLFGIKATSGKYFQRIKNEIPLTQRQIEIIYGSMMGDAGKKSNSMIKFKHCEKQKEYIQWKYNELKNISSEKSFRRYVYNNDKYNLHNTGWSFYTRANSEIEKCNYLFYKFGEKDVNQEILDKLTPLSVAIWFMDDGSAHWKNKNNVEFILCTQSFSEEGCNLIIKWFNDKWGIKCHKRFNLIKKSGKNGYILIFDAETKQSFISLIKPYIVPCMLYKVDYDAFLDWKQ